MIEPVGGRTVSAGKGGVDTHTLYPNGSNYQRLNPQGPRDDDPKAAVDHVHGYEADGSTKIQDPADNNPHFPTK
jgi:hypothetical protein